MTISDSAAIVIVTHAPDAERFVESWMLSPSPSVEIGGGAAPEVPLHRVSAVAPLVDAGVAVGTNDPPRVLLLDRAGGFEREIGRAGEGPGEFADVTSVLAIGSDSIGVWDADRRRLSLFGRDGRHGRDLDLSQMVPASPRAAPGTSTPAAFTRPIALGDDTYALLVSGTWNGQGGSEGLERARMRSVRLDNRGGQLATYGPFPGLELFWIPGLGPLPHPLGADLHAASSETALVVGSAEAPEIRFYGGDGELSRIVRWEVGDRTVEGSWQLTEFRAWLDRLISARDPREREYLREAFEAIPVPDRLPPYRDVVGDPVTGEVWVGSYPGQLDLPGITPEVRPMPERRWWVFDHQGTLRATAVTPARFDLRAVQSGTAWGIYRDELDVESVRMHEILPRP